MINNKTNKQVVKLDGSVQEFIPEKIAESILKAALKVGGE